MANKTDQASPLLLYHEGSDASRATMNLLRVQFCYSKVWSTTLQNSPITPLCNEVGGNATGRGPGPTCPLLPRPPSWCLTTKCAEFWLARWPKTVRYGNLGQTFMSSSRHSITKAGHTPNDMLAQA
ncbi:hypothetical protein EVAR_16705_1 [Eumeta japonica]|uniref:Uncharacterized protein n=1 Tax=Eumeta variegata TaxID=151549 RepID=A0A4C1V511_EUMVA|nr:hypothetical protein EVAR_16705_1 [Eumeta japonica]